MCEELSEEEKEIIRRFRGLSSAKQEAVKSNRNSFIEWLKSLIIWGKIAHLAAQLWEWFTDLTDPF